MNTKGHESKGRKARVQGCFARHCSVSPLCGAESLVETLSSFVFIRVHSWFNGMLPAKSLSEKGWNGRPARWAGQPAQRNKNKTSWLKSRLAGAHSPHPSVGLGARRHWPVAVLPILHFQTGSDDAGINHWNTHNRWRHVITTGHASRTGMPFFARNCFTSATVWVPK